MKIRTSKICFSLLLILFLVQLNACSLKEEQKVLNPLEYSQAIRSINKPQLIDVRTQEEFESGHIEGAVNYNYYDNNFRNHIKQLNKKEPVYLYCRSGSRSAKASEIFREEGFIEVYDLRGGVFNWMNNNLPISK